MPHRFRTRVVITLGLAQTLAWASTFYLPAILAEAMSRDLGTSVSTVFAAFSLGLAVTAVLGPLAGRTIDQRGGKPVLVASNAMFAVGLVVLAFAQNTTSLFSAWVLLGAGMACGLYDAAFAAVVRIYGHDSRKAITGITLFAGFASTVGWPITTALEAALGWRGACLAWASAQLLLVMPLNLSLPRGMGTHSSVVPIEGAALASAATPAAPHPRRTTWLLAFIFAAILFMGTAMGSHLPGLVRASGAPTSVAVLAGSLMGPAQVAGRLLEFGVLQRLHPLVSARWATALHPLGATLVLACGAVAAVPLALLHGMGNGILTITKGTLPLALFGPQGYGERQGLLLIPGRIAQALAPWLFGLLIEAWGAGALWFSAGLGLLALAALMLIRRPASA